MQFLDNTYRAIELLRCLRRATPEHPWTSRELAIAIVVDDESITSRLAPLYRIGEKKENNVEIHNTIRKILYEEDKQNKAIPSIDSVKATLNELLRHSWVEARRGKGYWLTNEGRQALLIDVLHAFGEDVGTAICCRERNRFCCPYRNVCQAQRFHKQLSSQLRKILEGITIEDIALGTWQLKHKQNNRKRRKVKNKQGL